MRFTYVRHRSECDNQASVISRAHLWIMIEFRTSLYYTVIEIISSIYIFNFVNEHAESDCIILVQIVHFYQW